MENDVSMSVDDTSHKIPSAQTIIIALPALDNVIKSRNDPIEEPGNVPADEEEVDYMHTDEQRL